MYKKRSKVWTVALSVLLLLILLFQVSIFIVGPKLKYDNSQEKIYALIRDEVQENSEIYRHVFEHISYTTKDNNYIYWFNSEGQLVEKKDISTLQLAKVEELISEYKLSSVIINIGYGHDAPAYEIKSDEAYIMVDYETLDIIHLRKER